MSLLFYPSNRMNWKQWHSTTGGGEKKRLKVLRKEGHGRIKCGKEELRQTTYTHGNEDVPASWGTEKKKSEFKQSASVSSITFSSEETKRAYLSEAQPNLLQNKICNVAATHRIQQNQSFPSATANHICLVVFLCDVLPPICLKCLKMNELVTFCRHCWVSWQLKALMDCRLLFLTGVIMREEEEVNVVSSGWSHKPGHINNAAASVSTGEIMRDLLPWLNQSVSVHSGHVSLKWFVRDSTFIRWGLSLLWEPRR